MSTTRSPHLNRLPALDGLRGLAALAVVVAHLSSHWGVLPFSTLGGIGVLVFFVLSGYLIARLTLRMPREWVAYVAFVQRRAVRLGPAIVALAAVVPLGLWLDGMPGPDAAAHALRALTQTTGLANAFGWNIHPAMAPPWSLTTEWLFYILFPLAVLAARRRGASTAALLRGSIGAAFALFAASLPLGHPQFYSLPVANVGAMLVGAALAFAEAEGWQGPVMVTAGPAPKYAFALIVIFAFLPGGGGSWGYRFVVFPATVVAAVVLIHAVHHQHPVARALAIRPLVATGIRAYSLYLWHLPVMWLIWRLFDGQRLGLMILVGLPLIAVVTWTSFWLLERPVLPAIAVQRRTQMSVELRN